MKDNDYWDIEPRFMNLCVCLSKQEPHDRSVLLEEIFVKECLIIILSYLILSYLILSYLILSYLILSYQVGGEGV